MYFADLLFLYFFLPLCFLAYFFARKTKQKNIVLLIFSLIFYAWGEPVKILLLVGSAFVNYLLALGMDKYRSVGKSKRFLVISLIFNIGMLGIFKYTDFVIENINAIFRVSIPLQHIGLPLGISFFTFQIISYMIDVYWEKVAVQKNFGKLLMYISLFPQLVAGPIVRYETIADEIDNRKPTLDDLSSGFTRLIVGLTKKVMLANNLNLLVEALFGKDLASATVAGTWIGIIAYSMQVYFDFSGYSDMAIGLGRIFGFHFDENFRYPFMCRSISEFWQRWHISLGSFFRDYLLYLPIFGKRRPIISLFLVWFTTGLWHGASWNYVLWGLYFGVFIFIETLIGKKRLKKIPDFIMHIYSKLVIFIGFGIFKFESMSDLGNFFKNLIGLNGNKFISENTTDSLLSYLFVIIIAVIACFPIVQLFKKKLANAKDGVQTAVILGVAAFSLLMLFVDTNVLVATSSTNNPFLYFRF